MDPSPALCATVDPRPAAVAPSSRSHEPAPPSPAPPPPPRALHLRLRAPAPPDVATATGAREEGPATYRCSNSPPLGLSRGGGDRAGGRGAGVEPPRAPPGPPSRGGEGQRWGTAWTALSLPGAAAGEGAGRGGAAARCRGREGGASSRGRGLGGRRREEGSEGVKVEDSNFGGFFLHMCMPRGAM